MGKSVKNIRIAFLLNLFFSIIELLGGIFTNSISIISDSVHDFGDAISIGVAFSLEKKSKKKPDEKYTYGYLRYSLIGALITSMILLIGSILVIYNLIPRLINPAEVNYDGMIILAIIGVVVNGIATYRTSHGHSLNEKAVSLHMLEDVLGWIAVLIGSVVIKFTSWYIIDPILSIIITIFILINVVKNIKSIFGIFLEKIPENIDIEKIKKEIMTLDIIENIHHIHVWSMDSSNNYLTMHCLINKNATSGENENVKKEIKTILRNNKIEHSTIEIEYEKCNEEMCKIRETDSHCHHHHHHH